MLNLLNEIAIGTVISVYTDASDTEKFSAGFYLGNDDTDILLAHITPYGKYDGYLTKRIDDVFLVETGNQYCEKLAKLFSLQNQKYEQIFKNEFIIIDLISWAQKNHKIVSIELVDSGCFDVQGYIQSFESGLIKITCIDDFGKNNGISYVKLQDISSIVCDSEKEYSINILANNFKINATTG